MFMNLMLINVFICYKIEIMFKFIMVVIFVKVIFDIFFVCN